MKTVESLSDFYKRKFDFIPDNLKNEIGHINIFRLQPYVGKNAKPVPYSRRDFYKVMLVKGGGRVHYADHIFRVKKRALSFSNPHIPYKWENTDEIKGGVYCIFDHHFLEGFGNIEEYSVFQPTGKHIFELSDEDVVYVEDVFNKMLKEIQSDYKHKYDLLRNLIFELAHFAMKMQPPEEMNDSGLNASHRIYALFLELLERQFPVDQDHRKIHLRTPSDFARQLNIHVNHLNRVVKEMTGKTTSAVISERILLESKLLLRHSKWDIAEIAYALNFMEPTHFSNFFKKNMDISPISYRKNA